jgi:hypothetical protein
MDLKKVDAEKIYLSDFKQLHNKMSNLENKIN